MNEYFKRQTEEFMNAAKVAQMPENLQAFAQESVAKTREAYDKLSTVAKDQAKATEEFLLATQAGAKAIGARVLDNATANTEAVFNAAQAIDQAASPDRLAPAPCRRHHRGGLRCYTQVGGRPVNR